MVFFSNDKRAATAKKGDLGKGSQIVEPVKLRSARGVIAGDQQADMIGVLLKRDCMRGRIKKGASNPRPKGLGQLTPDERRRRAWGKLEIVADRIETRILLDEFGKLERIRVYVRRGGTRFATKTGVYVNRVAGLAAVEHGDELAEIARLVLIILE